MKNDDEEAVETNATDATVSRTNTVWYVLAIAVLAASGFSFVVPARSAGEYSKSGPSSSSGDLTTPSSLPISQGTQPAVIIGGIGVTVTRQGFQPGKITRSPGRFVLAVVNKTGLGSLSLTLESPLGLALSNKQLPKEEPRWTDVYDLSPGRYTLRETNHPSWVCEIIIN